MDNDVWKDPNDRTAYGDEYSDVEKEADENEKPKKHSVPRKVTKRVPRPKLMVEDLKKPEGIKEVFNEFSKHFAAGFKGRGHEVRDLRRLLELYQRWQYKIFPHGTYQDFQDKLEQLGAKKIMQDELNIMRQELENMVDPPAPEEPQDEGQKQQQQQNLLATSPVRAGPQDMGMEGADEVDDDELLAMQADADWDAAEAAMPEAFGIPPQVRAATTIVSAADEAGPSGAGGRRRLAARQMADWSDEDDDDEKRGQAGPAAGTVAAQGQQQQQALAGHAAKRDQGELDDDELLALMEEDMEQPGQHTVFEQQQQQQGNVEPGGPVGAGETKGHAAGAKGVGELDDEELLDLLEYTYTDNLQGWGQQQQQDGTEEGVGEAAARTAEVAALAAAAAGGVGSRGLLEGGTRPGEEGLEDELEDEEMGMGGTAATGRKLALDGRAGIEVEDEGQQQQQGPRKRLRRFINDSSDDEEEQQGPGMGRAAVAGEDSKVRNLAEGQEMPRDSCTADGVTAAAGAAGGSDEVVPQGSAAQPAPDGSIPADMLRFALLETAPDEL